MRQNLHDFVDVESAFAGGKRFWFENRPEARKLFGERANELGIRTVAGLDRDDMAANPLPEEREVADDIEDFVPDESRFRDCRL
jgi:hypothetical protein